MKQLITRPNRYGIGIDVGWRIPTADGLAWEAWWGNTRDVGTLCLLIEDCRRHAASPFTLAPKTEAMIAASCPPGPANGPKVISEQG